MRRGLEHAARTGDVSGIKNELVNGADVNSLDRYGQTALMLAAHGGHLAVVQCLVRHGARLDVRAKFGLSALMLAILSGQEAVARALVQAGAALAIRGTGAPGFVGKGVFDLAEEQQMKELCTEIAARQRTAT